MDLLSNFKPSMDRIFGTHAPQLRSSFQTILLVLQSIEELISQPLEKELTERKLLALAGAVRRHFEIEYQLMIAKRYDEYSVEVHSDKHSDFIQRVEMFCFNFPYSTQEQNMASYRGIQKWLLHHLLMDDAHFMQKAFGK
jgi:hemerythrin-like metal-binding protein